MWKTMKKVIKSEWIKVAVPGPFLEGLDYHAHVSMTESDVGKRILVPLGSREVVGVITEIIEVPRYDKARIKSTIRLLDENAIFSERLFQLIQWVSVYYHHPIGECFYTAMPKRLCEGKAFIPLTLPSPTRGEGNASKLTLNPEQAKALSAININGFQVSLLEGVTGSGKTEVYLQLIEKVLAQGKQALVLVPEIGLTPQTLTRFQERFGAPVMALHSELTEVQKVKVWQATLSGGAKIVIGTRSAVFVPFQALGVIIVDEEHDLSFKQQNGLRYGAREVAIKRAQLENVPIMLGSATPSLESVYHATVSKRYQHLVLSTRAGVAQPPHFQLMDMRGQPMVDGLSRPLIDACQKHIRAGGQVLFFINRRGYAPVLMCHACGWNAKCSHCDRPYTLHRYPPHLLCHHCLHSHTVFKACPKCQTPDSLLEVGTGTERIEEALQAQFPEYTVVRIDRSVTQKKGQLSALLDKGHSGEAQILIGTQMLAKGHHFSGVTMVGIVDIDSGLFSSDFRAIERVGQLIIQVAGRAGRESKLGEVYIQTHQPNHPALRLLLSEGYPAFAKQLMEERQQIHWPPFGYLALIRAESMNKLDAENWLRMVKAKAHTFNIEGVGVLGPIPASMPKRAGYHRFQLLLHCADRQPLNRLLNQLMSEISVMTNRKIRWSMDVDPQEVG